MEDIGIGKLIDSPRDRDAVHIAVAPVIAGEALAPGTIIAFAQGSTDTVVLSKDYIGIVDPFLKVAVRQGQRFWMFLNPGSIISLRHDWTHPAFVDKGSSQAEARLRKLALSLGLEFSELVSQARGNANGQGYMYCNRSDSEQVPANFWDDIAEVTGIVATGDHEDEYFSCSC